MKKILAGLFAVLTIASCVACADTTDKNKDSTGSGTETKETTASSDSDSVITPPDIPQSVNGDGADFVIFDQGFWYYTPLDVIDVGITEMNSEGLNDAAYNRDRAIEDQLGVKIVRRNEPECYDSYKTLQVLVSSGDCDIDLCLLRSAILTQAITNDILIDLDSSSLIYFDPESPWWDQNSYESLSVSGTHYGVCGDFTITDDLSFWTLYFNKSMISDMKLDNPYELVKSGEWTYDKLFAMAQEAAADIDGIDGMTYEDQWGVTYIRDTVSGMIQASLGPPTAVTGAKAARPLFAIPTETAGRRCSLTAPPKTWRWFSLLMHPQPAPPLVSFFQTPPI